ncbi:uncharacterized protein LOC144147061 isoform X2 [Haemaphysalis longicornis]
MDEESTATMDEECIVRGIYTFQEGDDVVIASREAYYKIFQTSSCGTDSQSANNVQGGQGSNMATQRAPPRPLDAASSGVPDAQPTPAWPTDPIFGLMGKVVKVLPTGHINVIFKSGETRSGNLPKSVKRLHSGAVQTYARKPTTYTVVPDALRKVPKTLPGDLVMFVPDICADQNLESMPKPCKCETKFCVGVVLGDSEVVAGAILVTKDEAFSSRRRLQLHVIARPEDNNFRTILKDLRLSDGGVLRWLEEMRKSMEELPDVDMTPPRMASPYAPGDDVELSEDLAMVIREHGPKVWRVSNYHSNLLHRRKRAFKRIESLQQHGKVVQVNSSGYCVVLFADATVWHIQSSFLKLVQGLEGYSEGEEMGFQKALFEKADTLIHRLMSYGKVELRKESLRAACFSGNKHLLSDAISPGLNVECEDENGNKPLHYAAHSNQPKIISHLLRLGADINATNNRNHTALQFAAKQGFLGCVRELTERHNTLNPNIQDDIGNTALHVAIANTNVGIFNELVELPNIDFTVTNKYGLNALHMAAMKGDTTMTEKILSKRGDLVDVQQQDHGYAALHFAAVNGHCQVVETLLAQVEKKIAERGLTFDPRLRMACFLLRHGADIICSNKEGKTPLEIVFYLRQPSLQVLVYLNSCTWIPDSGKCNVCLEAPAEISFTPCGHCLYCNDCAQPMKRCFSCRTLIVEKLATGHIPLTKPMPDTIKVIPTTSPKLTSDVYRMRQNPRGRCIIINNVNFDGPLEDREGSELDADCMKTLFTQLHFNVTVASNLTRDEMKDLLRRVSKAESHRFADCLVVILMSHGEERFIYGSDGEKLHLRNDVYRTFNNEECPALKKKPKIFLVQACRGAEWDNGTDDVRISADSRNVPDGNSTVTSEPTRNRIPVLSDMYIAYATIPGYIALRNRAMGSWFLSAVTKVFSEHACSTSLDGLMDRVHEMVMECRTLDGCKQTPEVNKAGWPKKFYFNPGYFV